jgi:hypothetical protein
MEADHVRIDLVTKRTDGGCVLVLVETGPWTGDEKNQGLQRLARRITDCVSAVINGHIAAGYPATMGAPVTIQVDSYDTPRLDVDILLAKMQNAFDNSPDIQEELRLARFTSAIVLEHRWSDFVSELARRSPIRRFWRYLKRSIGWGASE